MSVTEFTAVWAYTPRIGYTEVVIVGRNVEGIMESKYGFINPIDFSGEAIKKAQDINATVTDILNDLVATIKMTRNSKIIGPKEDKDSDVERCHWILIITNFQLKVTLDLSYSGVFSITVQAPRDKLDHLDYVHKAFQVNASLVASAISEATGISSSSK